MDPGSRGLISLLHDRSHSWQARCRYSAHATSCLVCGESFQYSSFPPPLGEGRGGGGHNRVKIRRRRRGGTCGRLCRPSDCGQPRSGCPRKLWAGSGRREAPVHELSTAAVSRVTVHRAPAACFAVNDRMSSLSVASSSAGPRHRGLLGSSRPRSRSGGRCAPSGPGRSAPAPDRRTAAPTRRCPGCW